MCPCHREYSGSYLSSACERWVLLGTLRRFWAAAKPPFVFAVAADFVPVAHEFHGKDTMKRKASISHAEAVIRELRKNPEFAAEYVRAALEENDEPGVLLIALRCIAEARGGIAKVAKAAGIERDARVGRTFLSDVFS